MLKIPARILLKDLVELAQSKALLVLVFLAPLVLVLLIGNIRVKEPVLRIAIHAGDPAGAKKAGAVRFKEVLEEQSNVSVNVWTEPTPDLLGRLRRERIDLLASWEGRWRFYTAQTQPYRLQRISAVVQYVLISLEKDRRTEGTLEDLGDISRLIKEPPRKGDGAGKTAEEPRSEPPAPNLNEAIQMLQKMEGDARTVDALPVAVLFAFLSDQVTRYFPAVSQVDRSAVPGLIALILAFTPFLLASGALARERESGMLGVLVLAARRRWLALAAGKLLLPILIALVSLLLQLVFARSVFSFGPKPGMAGMLTLQLLAAINSGLLGLAVSALVRSQQQAYLLSAVYLLCLMLATGFIYPLEQAGLLVRFASCALPLTFSGPAFEGWLTQGAGLGLYSTELVWLLGQCVATAALCAATLRRFERSL